MRKFFEINIDGKELDETEIEDAIRKCFKWIDPFGVSVCDITETIETIKEMREVQSARLCFKDFNSVEEWDEYVDDQYEKMTNLESRVDTFLKDIEKRKKAEEFRPKMWALYENDRMVTLFESHRKAKDAKFFKSKEASENMLDLVYTIKPYKEPIGL